MGVPALFRWLSNKYPKIISPVIEEQPYEINGETIPVDTTKPNPNGTENDNLFLDMNGIVHPCTHPEGKPPPANEQEMMLEIFRYTDRVVNMVRPRKLLMIAVGMADHSLSTTLLCLSIHFFNVDNANMDVSQMVSLLVPR
jgi:5'-3' exoribonuclease 2